MKWKNQEILQMNKLNKFWAVRVKYHSKNVPVEIYSKTRREARLTKKILLNVKRAHEKDGIDLIESVKMYLVTEDTEPTYGYNFFRGYEEKR